VRPDLTLARYKFGGAGAKFLRARPSGVVDEDFKGHCIGLSQREASPSQIQLRVAGSSEGQSANDI